MLNEYKVILLDMNSTFMFGEDRFGHDEDYVTTYSKLGGTNLSANDVKEIIQKTYETMSQLYEHPDHFDDFPQVGEVMKTVAEVPDFELQLLEKTFAYHELGYIPDEYANMLRTMAAKSRLGLIANIWSVKHYWLTILENAQLTKSFTSMVFSSDSRSVKPSPQLFEQAYSQFNVDKSEVVFIGDSWRCDIEGAHNFGIDAIWINADCAHNNKSTAAVKHVIPDLLYLSKYVA